jgi:endogenous inhibitor of DNA gyrase (YacG/DUF329 family)
MLPPVSRVQRLSAPCPQCRKTAWLDAANPYRPFCSERCKLVDLGEWFAGNHRIPADAPPDPESGDSSG